MKVSKTILAGEGYQAKAMSRDFVMHMDRPIAESGTDTAPTPVEYLLTAIGGCVAMTLKHFVDRKQWDVGMILVNVMQKERLTPIGIEKYIIEEIAVEKKITTTQERKLLQMASKCSIAQMLKKETVIESTMIQYENV